ncbi:MAG: Hsp70 family protein [Sphingobacteriia bacterium]|nr:Hsp70 family protein [Sphingobacteriia bacterium]
MARLSIDFGTSYCAAAWLSPESGKPEAISFGADEYNNNKYYKFPSALIYAKDQAGNEDVIVGKQAYNQIISGKSCKNVCYKIKSEMRPQVTRQINGSPKRYEQIVADLFKAIKKRASDSCKQDFEEVTITHPANFEYQQLLIDAADIAGWPENKVTLLEEPIAAIYGFSINQQIPDNSGLVVFDYGGGTIDVTYLFKKSNNEFKWFFPPKGESKCGGEYIDLELYRYFCKLAKLEMSDLINYELLNKCRAIKINFSTDQFLTSDRISIGDTIYAISRNKFNELIQIKTDRAIDVLSKVLQECKNQDKTIDYLLLNGGSSKLPIIKESILKLGFNEDQLISFDGEDIAVALGGVAKYIENSQNKTTLKEKENISKLVHNQRVSDLKFKDPIFDNFNFRKKI